MKHMLYPTLIILLSIATIVPRHAAAQAAQAKDTIKLHTLKYAGEYGYGKDTNKGPVGRIIVYPETDNIMLFYLDLNNGAPAYNTGAIYGRVKIAGDTGTFTTNYSLQHKGNGCNLDLRFSKGKLNIKTVPGKDGCGFGQGVAADGEYKRYKNEVPDSFTDRAGKKIYFKNAPPDVYTR